MLRKILFFIFFTGLVRTGQAQVITEYKYWVGFKDKKDSPYSIERPKEFLSIFALSRRDKYGIAVDSTDLPVNPSYIEKVAVLEGVQVRNRSKWLNGITIYLTDTNSIPAIREMPFVREVKLVGYDKLSAIITLLNHEIVDTISATLQPTPKAKFEPKPVTLEDKFGQNYYGLAFNQIAMCNGDQLHKAGFNGAGVRIACLDAGFHDYHLLQAIKPITVNLIGTYDFVQGNDTVFDDDDHGLEVLSCMAAFEQGRMVGTAPAASYLLLRTEDAASEFPVEEINWVCAAEYADSIGVDLITSSVGYTSFDDKGMGHFYTELDGKTAFISMGADLAVAKGILVCTSAGNEGDNDWKKIGAPGDALNVFTIGSVDAKGIKSGFSSMGPTFDKRLKPTLAAMGELVVLLNPSGNYQRGSGTSFSTPVFSGMLACLLQANRNKTPAQIMEAVKMSGSHYAFPDNNIGYGIPDLMLANKILGGDTSLRLNQDQLVDISVPVNSTFLTVTFHAEQEGEVKFILTDRSGRKRINSAFKMSKGQTERFFLKGYKKLKPGKYVLYVMFGSSAFKAQVNK